MKKNRVFKFRYGTENDFDALFENYIWFADFSSLNDPFEGYVRFNENGVEDKLRNEFFSQVIQDNQPHATTHNIESINSSKDIDALAKKEFQRRHKNYRKNYFTLSLSLDKGDHPLHPSPLNDLQMWAHYANGFKGYCIDFDLEKLNKSIKKNLSNEEREPRLGQRYVKYLQGSFPEVNLKTLMEDYLNGNTNSSYEILDAFNAKEHSWQYENELRLTSTKRGRHYYNPSCINAIYIAGNMPSWAKSNITSAIKQKNSEISLFEVTLHDSEYKLGFEQIK
ncbi:DUF2971 domain-containing protein [Microbulbifer sp. VAAC004]|uniref:DUF2971 domain-containing protein n=1 Tax=unclassified Microbulbifer TaxID=2619833 RepID=UPI00403948CB